MAIAGLGTDIVELDRVKKALLRFEKKLTARILSPLELKTLPNGTKARVDFVASRFAVKEAAAKALGTGFSAGVAPADIETVKLPTGAPSLRLRGEALRRARELGVRACHLSISHSATHAISVVILESAAALQDELLKDTEPAAEE